MQTYAPQRITRIDDHHTLTQFRSPERGGIPARTAPDDNQIRFLRSAPRFNDVTLLIDRTLVVEAGTGTGKTFAYLLPALMSGRKTIISTGTKALQDQLLSSQDRQEGDDD